MEVNQNCPDCGKNLSTVKLGPEPARQICGRFGCSFDGRTLTPAEAEAKVNA